MASSYISYDELLKQAEAHAKEQQLAYATARNQRADETVSALNTAAVRSQAALQQQYKNQANQTTQAYQSAYDENAVSERIARLNVEEAMANMGLTNSGLNRSQQTAISSTRMNADAATTAQKQAALDDLLVSLNQSLAKSEQERVEQTHEVLTKAAEDVESNAQSLYNNATSRAKTEYEANADYAKAQIDLENTKLKQALEQYTAEAELQMQREKSASESRIEQTKLAATLAKLQNSSSSSSATSKAQEASVRNENLKILTELLEKRVNIFNPEWRANYDKLIEYYQTLVTGD